MPPFEKHRTWRDVAGSKALEELGTSAPSSRAQVVASDQNGDEMLEQCQSWSFCRAEPARRKGTLEADLRALKTAPVRSVTAVTYSVCLCLGLGLGLGLRTHHPHRPWPSPGGSRAHGKGARGQRARGPSLRRSRTPPGGHQLCERVWMLRPSCRRLVEDGYPTPLTASQPTLTPSQATWQGLSLVHC